MHHLSLSAVIYSRAFSFHTMRSSRPSQQRPLQVVIIQNWINQQQKPQKDRALYQKWFIKHKFVKHYAPSACDHRFPRPSADRSFESQQSRAFSVSQHQKTYFKNCFDLSARLKCEINIFPEFFLADHARSLSGTTHIPTRTCCRCG